MRAYYNENDKFAAAWLRELIKRNLIAAGDVDERSIVDVSLDDLRGYTQCHFFAGIGGWSYALRLAGWPDDRPVWTGSCPCQPFSLAGKGEGSTDKRHLWPEMFRLARVCRPEEIFGEQVASAIGHGWLDGISADLEAEGYAVGSVVLGAHSVGAPHIRQRLFWVADAGRSERGRRAESRRQHGGALHAPNRCEPRRLADGAGASGPEHVNDSGERPSGAETNAADGGGIGRLAHSEGEGYPGREHSGTSGDEAIEGARLLGTGGHGSTGRLANNDGQRFSRGTKPNFIKGAGQPASRRTDSGGCSQPNGMEHAPSDGRQQGRAQPDRRRAASGCGTGGVGNPSRDDQRRISQSRIDGEGIAAGGSSELGWMGEPIQPGLEGLAGHGDDRRESRRLAAEPNGSTAAPSCADFWTDFYLIPCRDGKTRRVGTGIQPLAHGISARVGKLRGAGNAIVPQVAAEFIKAFVETKGEI